METTGVHHVSLNVKNVDEAIEFYTNVIGLKLRTDRPAFAFGGAWLDVGGQQVHLIEGDVPQPLGQHFAFLVEDLNAVVAELRGRGIDVSDPRPVGQNRQAFLSDPAGNYLELQEVVRQSGYMMADAAIMFSRDQCRDVESVRARWCSSR